MSDDYLWNGTGEPDPDVERLERLLVSFRAAPRSLEIPERVLVVPSRRHGGRFVAALVAAAMILAATWALPRVFWNPQWVVSASDGVVTIDGVPPSQAERVAAGASIVTGPGSHVTLRVGGLGHVVVGPNSRLNLRRTTRDREEAELAAGSVHAEISAAPYVFLVRTPSAYALDMGCAYTLSVDPDGSGLLSVTEGWIEFQHGLIQSMVPAGAAAETRPGVGPGAPYFQDASPAFRAALSSVNFEASDQAARSAALASVLAEARPRDAFTLLNLFRRVDAADRGRLYDRLVLLEPAAAVVTKADAVSGRPGALDPVWSRLGLAHLKKSGKPVPLIEE